MWGWARLADADEVGVGARDGALLEVARRGRDQPVVTSRAPVPISRWAPWVPIAGIVAVPTMVSRLCVCPVLTVTVSPHVRVELGQRGGPEDHLVRAVEAVPREERGLHRGAGVCAEDRDGAAVDLQRCRSTPR